MTIFQASLILIFLTGSALVSCQRDVLSYLEKALKMIEKEKDNICPKDHKLQTNSTQKALDCSDWLHMGFNTTGIYEIYPMNRVTEGKPLKVWCDMDTDNGGWTVIQRQGDFGKANDYFDQDWSDYKIGFVVKLEKDFWLGNDNIFALTNQKRYSVRFDMKDFNQEKTYALYRDFFIDDENHKYTLHIFNYTGDAGDGMDELNYRKFSTKDQDNYPDVDCAKRHRSGWWYHKCRLTNLNGVSMSNTRMPQIIWKNRALAWAEIKIRPKNF